MLFSVFCGVSLFDLLLIVVAIFSYFRNKYLSKKIEKQLKESYGDLKVNKEGQILEEGVQEDNNAWQKYKTFF